MNIPWISPELEFWKRRQSSKRLLVLAGLQLPAKLLCSAQTGWSQARVLLLTGSLQHHTPSPLPPSWLGSKASGQLCLGGFTFHCLHLLTGTGRGGGEWGMAMGWWIAGSHGKRAGQCRQRLHRECRGQKQQSQALVPDLDLWPACSCRDEERGFKSALL